MLIGKSIENMQDHLQGPMHTLLILYFQIASCEFSRDFHEISSFIWIMESWIYNTSTKYRFSCAIGALFLSNEENKQLKKARCFFCGFSLKPDRSLFLMVLCLNMNIRSFIQLMRNFFTPGYGIWILKGEYAPICFQLKDWMKLQKRLRRRVKSRAFPHLLVFEVSKIEN